MDDNSLSLDTPNIPHTYDNLVTDGKSVILVRYFFSSTGDVEKIYSNYIDEKITELNN